MLPRSQKNITNKMRDNITYTCMLNPITLQAINLICVFYIATRRDHILHLYIEVDRFVQNLLRLLFYKILD